MKASRFQTRTVFRKSCVISTPKGRGRGSGQRVGCRARFLLNSRVGRWYGFPVAGRGRGRGGEWKGRGEKKGKRLGRSWPLLLKGGGDEGWRLQIEPKQWTRQRWQQKDLGTGQLQCVQGCQECREHIQGHGNGLRDRRSNTASASMFYNAHWPFWAEQWLSLLQIVCFGMR